MSSARLPRCIAPLFALLLLMPHTAAADVINSVLVQWRTLAGKCEEPNQLDAMAVMHVAMFEAVNAIAGQYRPYVAPITAPKGASADAAAAVAAHDVMMHVCPAQKEIFAAGLKTSLATVTDSVAREQGLIVGRQAAAAVIAARAASRAAAKDPFYAAPAAGVYAPTTRRIGMVQAQQVPWVMREVDELRPAAPPALTSAAYARSLDELKRLGGKTGSARTPEQTDIAQFWAGRDVRIVLRQLIGRPGRSLMDDARFLALAEMAWADSYVAMMDGKYAFNLWRPVTAIRGAAADGNDATQPDSTWEPLRPTPGHPEYPCGHCLSAAAVGTVIAEEFGAQAPAMMLDIDGTMLRRYDTPQSYIDEVGEARILVGVHYRFSVEVGTAMGVRVGKLARERYFAPVGAGRR